MGVLLSRPYDGIKFYPARGGEEVGFGALIDLGGVAEALGDHGVEGAEVFFFAFGEAAVDLHEGKEAGAAEIDRGGGSNSAWILGHLPGAGIATAKHFAEVAAPETDFEIDVELGAFANQDEDFVEGVNGFRGEVELLRELCASKFRRCLRVALHHGCQVRELGGFEPHAEIGGVLHSFSRVNATALEMVHQNGMVLLMVRRALFVAD